MFRVAHDTRTARENQPSTSTHQIPVKNRPERRGSDVSQVDIPRRTAKNHSMLSVTENRRPGQLVLVTMDAAVLVGAGVAAAWIRFGSEILGRELDLILDHPGFIAYAILAQFALAVTFDLYRPESWRTRDYVLARMAALGISLAVALALGQLPGSAVALRPRSPRPHLAPLAATRRPRSGCCGSRSYRCPSPRRAVVIGDGPIVGALKEVLDEPARTALRDRAPLPRSKR